MPPTQMTLLSCKANQEGNQIIFLWSLHSDPGGWLFFKHNKADFANLAVSCLIATSGPGASGINSDVALTNANATARGASVSGALNVTSTIEIRGPKLLQRGETATISIPANLFVSNDFSLGHAGFPLGAPATIDTSAIGLIPKLLAADPCHIWIEARAQHIGEQLSPPVVLAALGNLCGRTANTLTQSTAEGKASLVVVSGESFYSFEADDFYIGGNWFNCHNFHISATVKYDGAIGTQTIIAKAGTSSNYEMALQSNGSTLRLLLSTHGNYWSHHYNIATIAAGVAMTIDVVKNGSLIEAAVNGNWQTLAENAPATVFAGTAAFSIGSRTAEGVGIEFLNGDLACLALYSSVRTEPERAVITHHAARRAAVSLSGGTLPTSLPYTSTQHPRKPIGVVNLFGGVYEWVPPAPPRDNLSGQSIQYTNDLPEERLGWWDGPPGDEPSEETIQNHILGKVDEILAASDEFDIQFRLPGGRLQDDIMSSAQFPYTTSKQLGALRGVFTLRNLGSGENGTRRAWFYRGTGLCVIEDTFTYDYPPVGVRTRGRMNNRVLAFSKVSEWLSIAEEWKTQDQSDNNEWVCFFCDAGSHMAEKFIQLAHDSTGIATG